MPSNVFYIIVEKSLETEAVGSNLNSGGSQVALIYLFDLFYETDQTHIS